jgi:hypothetical protein
MRIIPALNLTEKTVGFRSKLSMCVNLTHARGTIHEADFKDF